MARRTRLVLLSLALILSAVAAAAAAQPSVQEMFARARRVLRQESALDSEADSPSTPPRTPPAAPAASSEADSPSLTGVASNSPAPHFPALLALPAAPTGHHDPPRAPPAPPASQRRALPSGRTTAPTCTFVTYIGGGGAEVAEVVRGGDGRVFVVGPGSTWDKTLAAESHQEPSTDAPNSDDSSEEEEEEEEEDEDGYSAVFTVAVNNFCEVFGYARAAYNVMEWIRDRAGQQDARADGHARPTRGVMLRGCVLE